jgi:hypothetical protein
MRASIRSSQMGGAITFDVCEATWTFSLHADAEIYCGGGRCGHAASMSGSIAQQIDG